MRESLYYFIDGTWYKTSGMAQIIVIMFKDIITKDKIPGFLLSLIIELKNYMKECKNLSK